VGLGSKLTGVIGAVSAVAACAVAPPSGPTVMAVPPAGTSLAVFQQDDGQCRNYAASRTGILHPGQVGAGTVVGSAAVGTVLGAATGAAIGAAAGNAVRVRRLAVRRALWAGQPSVRTMQRPVNTIYRHATTSLIRSACTRSAMPYRMFRSASTTTMNMRVRAILGTIGMGRACLEEGSLCSTADFTAGSTTASMMGTASTASTELDPTAEVVGAADLRRLPKRKTEGRRRGGWTAT
jgi:hypothetical protein